MFDTEIARGIELLDREAGFDWPFRVDIDELDIKSRTRCLGGQLFGHYDKMPMAARNTGPDDGFSLTLAGACDAAWACLNSEWRTAIRRLREERRVEVKRAA